MRTLVRATTTTVLAMLSCVALGAASMVAASTTWAVTQGFLVPGTGSPDANNIEGYIENAQTYYMTPFSDCTDDSGCDVRGIDYPAQFWPIPIPGWGGISAPSWNESVGTGVEALNNALSLWLQADQSDDEIVVFGYSQGARVVSLSKEYFGRNLLDPAQVSRLRYVVIGNISRPNGGAWARLSALGYVPIWDVTYGHATPTNLGPDCTDGMTECTTTDITLEFDGVADFPNYLFNVLSVLNALAGVEFVHPTYLDPNEGAPQRRPDGYLPGQGYTPEQLDELLNDPANQQRFGDTLYIRIPTPVLPIVQPALILANSLPILAPVIDPFVELISPVLRWEIDNGYDRTINPGVPTGLQFFRVPFLDYDPLQEAGEFFAAVQQGISDVFDGVAPAWRTVAPATAPAVTPTQDTDQTQVASPPQPDEQAAPAATELRKAKTGPRTAPREIADAEVAAPNADKPSEAGQRTTARSGNKFSPGVSRVTEVTPSTPAGDEPTSTQSSAADVTADGATDDASPIGTGSSSDDDAPGHAASSAA